MELIRQSVFRRLAGYEDVNDTDRLAHNPATRAVVDRSGLGRAAASTSQMDRLETRWLTQNGGATSLRLWSLSVTVSPLQGARIGGHQNGAVLAVYLGSLE